MTNVTELIKTYGSPVYVYDQTILEARCYQMQNFQKELSRKLNDFPISMHYSTKANSNPAILEAVKKAELNVDCMSPYELDIIRKCGFTAEQMLYVCNNIDLDEMKAVHKAGILICLDSVSQVETWGQNFPGTDIMVRINPGTRGVGHSDKVITSGNATKFGISEDNLPALFEVAKKYDLHIIGVHQHLGSLFLNNKVPEYLDGVKAGLYLIQKYFNDVEFVDLGGGFGVPYRPDEDHLDLSYVANELAPILNEFVANYPSVKEFKFEPGRYIPCECGKIYGTVTAVKPENDTWYICTDIGMNVLVRPSMYDSYHEIILCYQNEPTSEKITANFCGNVCESGDILGKNRCVHLPEVGDVVVIHNAGAYGYSMASNYTGRPRPAEVMVYKDGSYKLIRKRETLEYMAENIVW